MVVELRRVQEVFAKINTTLGYLTGKLTLDNNQQNVEKMSDYDFINYIMDYVIIEISRGCSNKCYINLKVVTNTECNLSLNRLFICNLSDKDTINTITEIFGKSIVDKYRILDFVDYERGIDTYDRSFSIRDRGDLNKLMKSLIRR